MASTQNAIGLLYTLQTAVTGCQQGVGRCAHPLDRMQLIVYKWWVAASAIHTVAGADSC